MRFKLLYKVLQVMKKTPNISLCSFLNRSFPSVNYVLFKFSRVSSLSFSFRSFGRLAVFLPGLIMIFLYSCNSQIKDMNELDVILKKQIENHKTPSVQYAFFNKDSIIYTFKDGFADIQNQKKITDKTTYNVYSITKTFTALAVLQLAEQGKIDIEQSVKKYLPDFPYSSQITIRQLLSHSAGIPNPIPLNWVHLAESHQSFDRNLFFQPVFADNAKTKSKPNQKYAYSNLGYVLLGQLIEKVSGSTYEAYIAANILKPLGIKESEMGFTVYNPDRHAKGYHKKYSLSNLVLTFMIDKSKLISGTEGKWNAFNTLYVNGVSYGGLIGNANAFIKYIQELLKPNCALISDEYKKQLFTENITAQGKPTGMCLSWFKGELCGNQYFCHAGGGGAYYCEIRIYPEKGVGSLIMFNRTGMSDERFLDKLDAYFMCI